MIRLTRPSYKISLSIPDSDGEDIALLAILNCITLQSGRKYLDCASDSRLLFGCHPLAKSQYIPKSCDEAKLNTPSFDTKHFKYSKIRDYIACNRWLYNKQTNLFRSITFRSGIIFFPVLKFSQKENVK